MAQPSREILHPQILAQGRIGPVFQRIAETIILEAMRRGDFEVLSGKGRPIDLTAYFEAPPDVRVVQSLLRNAGVLPREAELLRDISELGERSRMASSAEEKAQSRRRRSRLQLELDLLTECKTWRRVSKRRTASK